MRFYIYFFGTAQLIDVGSQHLHSQHWTNEDPKRANLQPKSENFEDIKDVIRGRNSKNDRQYNGQKKKTKWQAMIYKTLQKT